MISARLPFEAVRTRLRRSIAAPSGHVGLSSFDPPIAVRLLVLQPTPFCNLDCDYCYLPDRAARDRMSPAVVEATLTNIIRAGLLPDRLSVVWHAGEPLAVPPAFYREAFDCIRSVLGGRCPVRHSIQTNATLIDPAWCELFRAYDVRVGVSLDGPARIHDRHRVDRRGLGTHAKVLEGIDQLRRHGIPFHVIAVATDASLDAPEEIFGFFRDQGIPEVGFNIDEREGRHARSSLGDVPGTRVDRFFATLARLSRESGGAVRIRELEGAREAIVHPAEGIRVDGRLMPRNPQVLPLEILTVDWSGRFSTFSPELIGQPHLDPPGFVFGNVLTDELADLPDHPAFLAAYDAIRRGVERCRAECEYFECCGGGAPANKFYENGTFASTETVYCRASIQGPLRIALGALEASCG